MSHIEIELCLGKGITEKIYLKPEKGEKLNLEDIFPTGSAIKKWFIREAN